MYNPARSKNRDSAFTLIELLVVISIVALLASMVVPGLRMAKEKARRIRCVSNTRQCSMACNVYASDYQDYLPMGNQGESDDDIEVWTKINFQSCLMMRDNYGLSEDVAMCTSWKSEQKDFFYEPEGMTYDGAKTGGTQIGYIYYGRRYDEDGTDFTPTLENGDTYISPGRVIDGANRATSRTLFTCYHWDMVSTGGQWGAKMPHVGAERARYYNPSFTRLDPAPDGMSVGYLDSSARWIKWEKLKWFQQPLSNRVYYSP